MSNKNILKNQRDFVGAGFVMIDDKHITDRQPRIEWGRIYGEKTEAEKIEYLQKLCASYNDAANRIQAQRDELGELCGKKEKQIESLEAGMRANNAMLQSEVTRLNEDRQQMLKTVAELNAKLKALRNGDHS